jgi:heptosyltransferase-1
MRISLPRPIEGVDVLRVLIVKLSSLGDVVHAMPAVQDILVAYPHAKIDWVVESGFVPLVQRCAGVDTVIAADLRRWRKSPFSEQTRAEWRAFKTQLQAQSYDAVIDLQGLIKSALVSWQARTTSVGKKFALAHRTDGSSYEVPTRWVADQAIAMEPHVHAVQRSRIVCAEALGYTVAGPARFGLHASAESQVAASNSYVGNSFAPRRPVVALVHGTSRADKQWPMGHWIAVGQRLNHSGFTVALAHGSVAEKATSDAIAATLQDAVVWPTMGLDALTDTLARCAGVIGVDSGLSHIAVALDLPHVQIYNFDTAWRTGPLADGGKKSSRQVSVFASPHPDLESVWQAWESLATPALCR